MEMVPSCVLALLVVVIICLQIPLGSSDFLAPLLSPVIGNFCKEVGCGRGKCQMSESSDFEYECKCDHGWKQSLIPHSNASALKFLPCVIPNCTLNYSCADEIAPAPSPDTPLNASIIEPCRWANCGGGVCNKTSATTYACNCIEGYNNLFNDTGFPCFKECSLGGDCSNMGLSLSNHSTTPPPSLSDTGSNRGSLFRQEAFHHVIVLMISIIIV